MKAFTIDRYRGELTATDAPEPRLGDHDVLIGVRAAGVNQLDLKLANGDFKTMLPVEFPLTLGHDVAGVVEAVGAAVARFVVGDAVFSRVPDGRIGTFAERIAVDESAVAHAPTSIPPVETASMPLVALTAWQALVERASVGPGARVLIHGGAGGFGSIAIQLAKHLGAHVVTTASARDADWLRELGADEVIDYRAGDVSATLRDIDVAIDGVGGETLERTLRVLRPGGLAIGIAGPPEPEFARAAGLNPVMRLAVRGLSARIRRQARRLGVHYSFLFMRPDGAALAEIASLVDAGVLTPVVGRVVPFEQTPDAVAALQRGGIRGKVVVDLTR